MILKIKLKFKSKSVPFTLSAQVSGARNSYKVRSNRPIRFTYPGGNVDRISGRLGLLPLLDEILAVGTETARPGRVRRRARDEVLSSTAEDNLQ